MADDVFPDNALAQEQGPSLDNNMWNTQLTHRQRVLLHTKPLLDLLRRDAHRSADLEHYDSLALALKLFDLIIEHTGLEDEIDDEGAILALTPLLKQMDYAARISPNSERHTKMVEGLLDVLRNDKQGRAPFAIDYIDFLEGKAVTRTLELWLLRNYHHPDGRMVLRLSSEAINIFLNALTLDIEDAQAAAEAVVASQLERHCFLDAVESARLAKLQSLRFQEKIEYALNQTKRDINQIDWRHHVPRLLDDARTHIQIRCRTERGIIEYANEQLDHLPSDSKELRQVAEVVQIVDECYQRHQQLVEQLIGARQLFLDEQERQAFAPQLTVPMPHLITDVLEPLLQARRVDASKVITNLFPVFFGAVPPPSFSLGRFLTRQLQTPREARPTTVPIQPVVAVEAYIEPLRYPHEISRRAEAYFDGVTGQTLSDLLRKAQVANESEEVLELIVWRALDFFDPDDDELCQLQANKIPGVQLHIADLISDDLLLTERTTDAQKPRVE